MAIPQEEYIKITSGVVADAASNRELIGRVLTESPICPTGKPLEFTSLASVGTYFGYASAEYAFAQKYFNFLSKDIKKPKKLSFMRVNTPSDTPGDGINAFVRFCAGENSAPTFTTITGGDDSAATVLFDMSYVENGETIEVGQVMGPATGTDLTSWTELVAYINSQLSSGAVMYFNVSPFYLYIKLPATSEIKEVSVNSGFDWLNSVFSKEKIVSQYVAAPTTWAGYMDYVDDTSNNFGTFTFLTESIDNPSHLASVLEDKVLPIARWNMGKNVKYMYVVGVDSATYSTYYTALKDIDGVWLQLLDVNTSYATFAPMAIGATFNYNQVNTNAFFDFYPIADFAVQVNSKTAYDAYTAARVNFNGQTQQAGQTIDFLQHGYLTGSISDAGVYYNEMWIKDDIWTNLMSLFLAVKKIPANEVGVAQCKGVIMSTINQALVNGSILIGKTLTNAQKAQIKEMTGSDKAVNSVQDDGFYLNLWVTRTVENGTEKYIIEYQLLYAKGDGIRKVEGTDILY